jgi:hypothetical protein
MFNSPIKFNDKITFKNLIPRFNSLLLKNSAFSVKKISKIPKIR